MKPQLLLIVLSAVLSAGCDGQGKPEKPQSEANIVIAKKVFEHFNNHEWTKMAQLYSDPAQFKDPSFGPDLTTQTRKQIIEKYSEM